MLIAEINTVYLFMKKRNLLHIEFNKNLILDFLEGALPVLKGPKFSSTKHGPFSIL